MRDPLHDARVAVTEPLIGIALVTVATIVIGAAGWILALLVGIVF